MALWAANKKAVLRARPPGRRRQGHRPPGRPAQPRDDPARAVMPGLRHPHRRPRPAVSEPVILVPAAPARRGSRAPSARNQTRDPAARVVSQTRTTPGAECSETGRDGPLTDGSRNTLPNRGRVSSPALLHPGRRTGRPMATWKEISRRAIGRESRGGIAMTRSSIVASLMVAVGIVASGRALGRPRDGDPVGTTGRRSSDGPGDQIRDPPRSGTSLRFVALSGRPGEDR